MAVVGLVAIDGESLEYVLEAHAVVGFFPHLLGEVEVRLWSVDVGVDTEGECLVHQQFAGVEVAHQEGNCVTFLVSHLLEISDVFTQLDFVGEPGVGHSLVVQVHRPAVLHGLEKKAFLNSSSEDSHNLFLFLVVEVLSFTGSCHTAVGPLDQPGRCSYRLNCPLLDSSLTPYFADPKPKPFLAGAAATGSDCAGAAAPKPFFTA